MSHSRRSFLKNATLVGATGFVAPFAQAVNPLSKTGVMLDRKEPKTLFFDVNETLLDLEPLKKSVAGALQGQKDLVPLWFTTMLQYSLVATTGNNYEDFGDIGAATLVMVAANNNIDLSLKAAKDAISPILSVPPHPEVKEALQGLKQIGYQLVSFTNSSNRAVESQLENAGLIDLFEARLSIEELGKYKPHRDTYSWAARKMGRRQEDCMLIAAHGWDIAGALWAGWRGAFISRPGHQLYPLAPLPEIIEPDLKIISKRLINLKG